MAVNVRTPSYFADLAVDNESDHKYTILTVTTSNRPGLLQLITLTFRDLGLDVGKAKVDLDEDGQVEDQFHVTDMEGRKITDPNDLMHIKTCVINVLNQESKRSQSSGQPAGLPVTFQHRREFGTVGDVTSNSYRRTELLYGLMDVYIKNDVLSIQKSIVDHVEYTVARSRYQFDDFEAYQVTATSAHSFSAKSKQGCVTCLTGMGR